MRISYNGDVLRCVGIAIAIAIGACGKSDPAKQPGGSGAAPSLTSVLKPHDGPHDAPPLPEACKAWQAAMTSYLACDRVPPDVRDAISKAFAATTAQWPKLADRDELGDACATGLDGIQTQLGAAGCR
jgi:hypothetical protein